VRRSARLQHVRGLGLRDHVCWAYAGVAEFRARAAEFLADGLDAGCRVRYIRPGAVGDIADDLRGWVQQDGVRPDASECLSVS